MAVTGDENPSLVVNSGEFPGDWDVMSEGTLQFSDRPTYVLTGVPDHLLGAKYFKGPCHSKGASLTISTTGTIYLLASHGNGVSTLSKFVFEPEPQPNTTTLMHTTSFNSVTTGFEQWMWSSNFTYFYFKRSKMKIVSLV